MAALPYVDSLWATKKRQIPFIVGNITIVWESSYGMTLRNPGQMQSDEVRHFADDAIERAFNEDLEKFTNDTKVRELIKRAGMYVELDDSSMQLNVTMEGENADPVVTSVTVAGNREIVHMTLDELLAQGFLTKGVAGGDR